MIPSSCQDGPYGFLTGKPLTGIYKRDEDVREFGEKAHRERDELRNRIEGHQPRMIDYSQKRRKARDGSGVSELNALEEAGQVAEMVQYMWSIPL